MTSKAGQVWRPVASGIAIRVRLTPRAQRDAIDGLEETPEGPALKARVRAVPESGAANEALERLVAEWLEVPKSAVAVTAGGKSRLKTVTVTGNSETLRQHLAAKLAAMDGPKPHKNA